MADYSEEMLDEAKKIMSSLRSDDKDEAARGSVLHLKVRGPALLSCMYRFT